MELEGKLLAKFVDLSSDFCNCRIRAIPAKDFVH